MFAKMFLAAWAANRLIKNKLEKALGWTSGAGYKKNKMTVATGRSLLLAYAMAYKAKRDIGFFSSLRM